MSRKPPEKTIEQLQEQTRQQGDALSSRKSDTQGSDTNPVDTEPVDRDTVDTRTDEERFGGPLPGNLARQVVSTTQGGFDGAGELSAFDEQAEKDRLASIDALKAQQDLYRGAGVKLIRVEGKEPLTAITYSAYPNPERNIQAGQPATHVFTDREMGADALNVPADLAIKAVSCQRCGLSPDLHKEPETLCRRCGVGESFHVKREVKALNSLNKTPDWKTNNMFTSVVNPQDSEASVIETRICRDGRLAEAGEMAKESLCPHDGGQGDFRFQVAPDSKVQLKGVSPVMREEAAPTAAV